MPSYGCNDETHIARANQMPTVALLMFSLNENDGILRNARAFANIVDEIVIVDSSSPEGYQGLVE